MPDNEQNVKKDINILSDWVKCVRLLIQMRNKKLNGSMSTCSTSIFKDPIVAKHLSLLNDKYVVVPAGKAPHSMTSMLLSLQARLLNIIGLLPYNLSLTLFSQWKL